MSTNQYFSFDGETYATHATEAEARQNAAAAIEFFRREAGLDGEWRDEVDRVAWGEIREHAEAQPDEHSEDDKPMCDYALAAHPRELDAVAKAMGAYPDSDLVSLATTLRGYGDTMERRDDAVVTECERIARYLRSQADGYGGASADAVTALRWFADAIERGEHNTTTPPATGGKE